MTVQDEGSPKLVIGTRTGNMLITASARLDVKSVNIGVSTEHFRATNETSIYLDKRSIHLAQDILDLDWTNCEQVQPGPSLAHLRQVRSKFYATSTYIRSRASLDITSSLHLRPSTIWTAFDHDSQQQTPSQEEIGSRLFQIIATTVFRDHRDAVLAKRDVLQLLTMCKETVAVKAILNRILGHFGNDDSIL